MAGTDTSTSTASGKWVWQDTKKELVYESSDPRASRRRQNRPWLLAVPTAVLQPAGTASNPDQAEDRKAGLDDIKVVAVGLISEALLQKMKKSTTQLFDECCRTQQMNALLWSTLLYFEAFLANHQASQDQNLHTPGSLGRGAREAIKSSAKRLEQTEVNVGAAYIHFVLGLGHTESHHSLQGRAPTSRTQTDQHFYEAVYEYIMYVTWITFHYKHWSLINSELGRLFRTMAFNRTIKPPGEGRSVNLDGLGVVSMDTEQYLSYRVYYDRPAVGSLKQLHSAAFTGCLTSCKDKAKKEGVRPLPQTEISCPERLGIIGEWMSKLDLDTLRFKDTTQCDSEADDDDSLSDISGILEVEGDGNDDF